MEQSALRFDRYEILAQVGEGGMGAVYKARAAGPHGFEKIVALKRMRPKWASDPTIADRFVREARIAARLQHANIVQVFDFGRHDDELFIVMEYVEGHSLHGILKTLRERAEWVSLPVALQITTDVARALECAHRVKDDSGKPVGVIHRDVSPSNILVSREGTVKLADFGIADWSRPERVSLIAGKPPYMAPEQLRGDSLDGRADLFALGIVLYELLTRATPWPRGVPDVTPGVSREEVGYEAPSKRASGVPPEIDALVGKLLEFVPGDRFASAHEVAQQLLTVSYACQIVLDPLALCPLVASIVREPSVPPAAGDPLARGLSVLVATATEGGGATLLGAAETVQNRGVKHGESRVTVAARPARKTRGKWLAVAITLVVAAAVLVAWPSSQADRPVRPPPNLVGLAKAPTTARPPAPVQPNAGSAAPPLVPTKAVVERRPTEHVPPQKATSNRPVEMAHVDMPPAPASVGRLNIFVEGWAEIWMDGTKLVPTAPVVGLSVPSGHHRIRLVNPLSRLEAQREVDVPPGGSVSLRLVLE